MSADALAEAKRRLPLPELMARLGDGELAKPSAKCPFHEDGSASFGIFQAESGDWLWKCHSGCGSGDAIAYLSKRRGLAVGVAIREFKDMAGVPSAPTAAPPPPRQQAAPRPPFDWQACLTAFTLAEAQRLSGWRGYSLDFVQWLHAQGHVGIYGGQVAFPVHADGQVVGCHFKHLDGSWRYAPKGNRAAALTFGDVDKAGFVLAFESQWDALAIMDKLGWHTAAGVPDAAVFVTRGAENGRLAKGRFAPDAACLAFKQNDAPREGRAVPAADRWLAELAAAAGCRVLNVATPAAHKDANDWTRAGATKAEIESAWLNAKPVATPAPAAAKPPPSKAGVDFDRITADARGSILGVLTDANCKGSARNRIVARLVVENLCRVGRLYFHAERKDFDSAMFFDAHAKRLLRIGSNSFAAWLSDWLHINRADPLFKAAFCEVETAALAGAHTTGILPEAYWTARPGALYLSNGDGSVAKVTADGVAMVDNGTDGVLFAAGRTLAPWTLTTPRDPFETCRLFSGAHCSAAHGKDLLRLWLYSIPTNPASKPPLCLPGTVGSGKTRTVKGFAELLGVPFVAHKPDEFGEDDFWPAGDNGGLLCLDNCDTHNKWLPDALASAATDGCSQRRRLYTNSEVVTLRARAWLAVTSANPTFAADSGLADRLLVARMERRDDEDTDDAALSAEIAANRNAGLSHIVQTLRAALADTAPTPPKLNARHPDFAAFAVKIGRALGREAEAVVALQTAEADKSSFCLENDSVAPAVLGYVRHVGEFDGSAAVLLPLLRQHDPELPENLSPRGLGKRLSNLIPHLARVFAVAKCHEGRCSKVFEFKSAGLQV